MWKKRETHLVDIYKNNQAKDDFLIPLTTVTVTDSETFNNIDVNNGNSIYFSVGMSKSHPSLLLSSSSSSSSSSDATQKKTHNSSTSVYQGNKFDVFGKEQLEEHFAPLYSIEQFTPTNPCMKERYVKGEILLRTEQEFKRGQVEAMLQNTAIIKKRKTSAEQADADITTTVIDGVFIKSTAAANTPIANIFLEDNNHNEDEDLAYY